jgi:error-prone DNA polymerase
VTSPTPYAELQVTSNFSFLRGASHPDELVAAAAALGHGAIAIADRNTLAGVVRAHGAARGLGLRLVVGAQLDFTCGFSVLCFPMGRAAYGRLSRLLTVGKRRAPKGQCHITRDDLYEYGEGQIVVALPPDQADCSLVSSPAFARRLEELHWKFGDRCYLAAQHLYRGDDGRRLAQLARLASRIGGRPGGVPLVATNDVHAHTPERRPLMDILTCIREGKTMAEAGLSLAANGERYLKPGAEMARLFPGHEDAVARTMEIAERCRFSLDELAYEYPDEIVAPGHTAQSWLAALTEEGAAGRYPQGVPAKVQAQIDHELGLIDQLGYAPYFLTVHDIVGFARGRGILCQGRGSAANSAVCYCLGVTAVDPAHIDLLFERFVSAERDEPPDIDVDFEHERREEVIQYIYGKYGRERAGLAATTITYRGRSAIRDVGKAMGLSLDTVGALAGRHGDEAFCDEDLAGIGLDPADTTLARTVNLARELIGFPRHLSQHVGGFVIARGRLDELVPIENAAMKDRTVIEWNKDDLDTLGLLKVDILGLGMLSCIRKAFGLLADHHGRDLDLAAVPAEDAEVYDMLCQGDSLGVFQVESRAQMTMLPRLKPRNFYDLVIEVAIVRPGPIQGDMVHPYLRRRDGLEPVEYPSPELEAVLGKTLGVPLFQEQAMRIAVVAAGFSPGEADALRRAMAAWRRPGLIDSFQDKLIDGMVANGYSRDFAGRCFKQILGFGEYGFPESHAASFALLVYVSAWLKRHYPAAYTCALLNSQPMGFYAPAQLVGDARDHGVTLLAVDVNHSDWNCTLEADDDSGGVALRLGLRQIKGLKQAEAERLVANRGAGYGDVAALARDAELGRAVLEHLARADSFRSLGLDRRQAAWAVKGVDGDPLPLFAVAPPPVSQSGAVQPMEPEIRLPTMALGEHVAEDYATTRLSLKCHPVAFLRDELEAEGVTAAADLADVKPGARITVAGLVTIRQRPSTAKGIIFVTLEDETGVINLVVRPPVFERHRRPLLAAVLLAATGRLEREGLIIHLIAQHLEDRTPELRALTEPDIPAMPIIPHPVLTAPSRNFR